MKSQATSQPLREYKVMLLGAHSVGATALAMRYELNQFDDSMDPTLELSFCKQILIENDIVILNVFAAGSQEEWGRTWREDMRSGDSDGYMLVYTISSRQTFDQIQQVYKDLHQFKSQEAGEVPIILVGNKCDLESEREVSTTEGQDLAKALGCSFRETSANSGLNVEEAFRDLAMAIRHREKRLDLSGLDINGAELVAKDKMGCFSWCNVL